MYLKINLFRALFVAILFWISLLLSVSYASEKLLTLNNTNQEPYTTKDKTGYLDLIVNEAFQRSGLSINLVKQPPERGLRNANSGQIDGDLTRIKGIDKLYPNLVRVPEVLIKWEFASFTNSPKKITDWNTIYNNPVGHITGWKIYEKKLHGAKNITVTKDSDQLFTLLSRHRVNSVLFEKWQGLALMKQFNISNIKVIDIEQKPMYIYLNKQHEKYIAKIASALKNLKKEGFYKSVYNSRLIPYKLPYNK